MEVKGAFIPFIFNFILKEGPPIGLNYIFSYILYINIILSIIAQVKSKKTMYNIRSWRLIRERKRDCCREISAQVKRNKKTNK